MEPIKVELEVGKEYAWCTCTPGEDLCMNGRTCQQQIEQPNSLIFTADRTEAYICTCKQTKSPPYCDGSHKQLSDVSG